MDPGTEGMHRRFLRGIRQADAVSRAFRGSPNVPVGFGYGVPLGVGSQPMQGSASGPQPFMGAPAPWVPHPAGWVRPGAGWTLPDDIELPDLGNGDSARLPRHGFLPGIDTPDPANLPGHGPGPSPGSGDARLGRLDHSADSEDATTQVDIFMSAGPNISGVGSCNMEDNRTCQLYRVRWDIYAHEAVEVELLVEPDATDSCDHLSPVEPAVAPGGASIAYIAQCQGAGGDELRTMALNPVGATQVAATGPMLDGHQPQWPDWYDDDVLLWDTDDGAGEDTDFQATMWVGLPDGSAAPTALIGPEDSLETKDGFENPRTHQDPQYKGAGTGPRVVTFGGPLVRDGTKDVAQHVPRVHDLFGWGMEEFDLGDAAFTECHHPDWNPVGTRILCTRQEAAEVIPSGTSGDGAEYYSYRQRMLYAFEYDGTTGKWQNSGLLFDPLDPHELQENFKGYDTPSGPFPQLDAANQGCETYVYKFGHWCGSDRYVIVTLFCHDADGAMVSSRVILIDTHPGHVRYYDVTAAVEDLESVELGTYHAGASACRGVSESSGSFA